MYLPGELPGFQVREQGVWHVWQVSQEVVAGAELCAGLQNPDHRFRGLEASQVQHIGGIEFFRQDIIESSYFYKRYFYRCVLLK